MGLIKKGGFIPQRPIVMVVYGVPGCGKTTMAFSADNAVLIDTDKGFDRAGYIGDVITAEKWEDIQQELSVGTFNGYSTIIVDTAKGVLDDYLWQYVAEQDKRLERNQLKRYGAVGEEFKRFVADLRNGGHDVVFIAHDKEGMDNNGNVTHSPSVTGQSRDLLNRIADQEGYMHIVGGRRVITFASGEYWVSKDTAAIGEVEVPAVGDDAFRGFLSRLIADTKLAIQQHSTAMVAYQAACDRLQEVADEKDANAFYKEVYATMPESEKAPMSSLMMAAFDKLGIKWDKKSGKFTKGVKDEADGKGNPA
ncbi:ATP-binding protein [Prevotella sp. KH2C16]|uniref:ATP-binding protein n=1 Tax=Prevotella sp. KH2C16 TaxID=1855325 RepID=UPI0008E35EFE|nr:ATP-binding protein [Prevotella sp. KH2C16]SFG12911.1 AAA domain-containing protein [Prevotella sp. KH2C16]